MKKFKKMFAFTLAEVLITLSILGVVAAITVPSLVKRQHRNEVETRLRKFYSTLQNVIDTSVAENGPVTNWVGVDSDDIIEKYVVKYLNAKKNSETWETYKTKDNKGLGMTFGGWCFKDGICFSAGHQTVANGDKVSITMVGNRAMWIQVDINGKKGPNLAGKDYFVFSLRETKEGSGAYKIDAFESDKTVSYKKTKCYGPDPDYHCGGVFIDNGLKFPSDYPWL